MKTAYPMGRGDVHTDEGLRRPPKPGYQGFKESWGDIKKGYEAAKTFASCVVPGDNGGCTKRRVDEAVSVAFDIAEGLGALGPEFAALSAVRPAAKGASAGRVVSTADRASELRALAGRNRVSIETPSWRLNVDLAGKSHFEKALGRSVDTPHVKFETRHVGPDGRVSYTSGPDRDATHADLRIVARVLAERGR
jgi:hypothetical protein